MHAAPVASHQSLSQTISGPGPTSSDFLSTTEITFSDQSTSSGFGSIMMLMGRFWWLRQQTESVPWCSVCALSTIPPCVGAPLGHQGLWLTHNLHLCFATCMHSSSIAPWHNALPTFLLSCRLFSSRTLAIEERNFYLRY